MLLKKKIFLLPVLKVHVLEIKDIENSMLALYLM